MVTWRYVANTWQAFNTLTLNSNEHFACNRPKYSKDLFCILIDSQIESARLGISSSDLQSAIKSFNWFCLSILFCGCFHFYFLKPHAVSRTQKVRQREPSVKTFVPHFPSDSEGIVIACWMVVLNAKIWKYEIFYFLEWETNPQPVAFTVTLCTPASRLASIIRLIKKNKSASRCIPHTAG